ncbi:MAG: lamin tail domain-containing protein [bacterium]|nr:lamin tail domain-containing protein [bacterium]
MSACQRLLLVASLCIPLTAPVAGVFDSGIRINEIDSGIRINEIDYDQPGIDTAEFIELVNNGDSAVSLDGLAVVLVNGAITTVYETIDLPDVSLAVGDYFVICANSINVANCDLDLGVSANLVQNGAPDAVQLFESGSVVDAVTYEGDMGAAYTEGSGSGLSDSGTIAGVGIARCPDGKDTNQNNVDFRLDAITPGTTNTCLPDGSKLVINEIDYDQPGVDDAEFVEIKNVGSLDVDLGSFSLEFRNGANDTTYGNIELPDAVLAAGDYFVVCTNAATVVGCDLDTTPDFNLIQNGAPDAVALRVGTTIMDVVSYEGDTTAPYTEGSGAGLEDPSSGGAGGSNENKSISRRPDGSDTDRNNVDFLIACATPGAQNTTFDTDCPAGLPQLVINEIDYDQPGADAAEFVEIKNVGAAPTLLVGTEIVGFNGANSMIYDIIPLDDVVLGPGQYHVVCGDAGNVDNCDQVASSSTNLLQNGSPDALALRRGRTLFDAVSYEGSVAAPFVEGTGAGTDSSSGGAGGVNEDRGLSRLPDGSDTGDNSADFSVRCITPGQSNTANSTGCADTDGDGVGDADDNCPSIQNPGQENSDTDMHGDACDNCPTTNNDDQLNNDGDLEGDACDVDDDNDGVEDGDDPEPFDPDLCGDLDADTCDDCTVGTDDLGPLADNDIAMDGPDADADGLCDAGDRTFFSVATLQIVNPILTPQVVYEDPPGPAGIVQAFVNSLPAAVNVDALDVDTGRFLFSVSSQAIVFTGGGVLFLHPGDVYESNAGDISLFFDVSNAGVNLRQMNALDWLGPDAFAFSVGQAQTVVDGAGTFHVLYPSRVYTLDTNSGAVTLVLDAAGLGFSDVDGIDFLPDDRIALSSAATGIVALPGGAMIVNHKDVYIFDPAAPAPNLIRSYDNPARDLDGVTLIVPE